MADFDLLTGKEDVPSVPQTSGKSPDVELSERLLLEWRALAETWRNQVVEHRDFVAGAQWDPSKKKEVEKRKQKPLVIDVVSPAVDQAIAMLTSNSPRFTSTGREDSDTRIARMFADLMAYVWDINSGNVKLKQTIKDYYVASCGWLVAYYDPQKNHGMGEVCIKSVDPLNVFPDPNARDFFLQDAAHILISTLETTEGLLPATIERDPLMIDLYPQCKPVRPGQVSYDDRAYVRHPCFYRRCTGSAGVLP